MKNEYVRAVFSPTIALKLSFFPLQSSENAIKHGAILKNTDQPERSKDG
jgi:hypothetical protein